MRRCYRCRENLPEGDFAPDPSKGSGYKSICRSCDNAKSSRYYERNRERVIARVQRRQAELSNTKGATP